jgi:ABC-2 type transport system ATP-binding protein
LIGSNHTEALKDVYFEVPKGELIGIMGHNGAGKSTLINVLCGLINRDAGDARIFDYTIENNL